MPEPQQLALVSNLLCSELACKGKSWSLMLEGKVVTAEELGREQQLALVSNLLLSVENLV